MPVTRKSMTGMSLYYVFDVLLSMDYFLSGFSFDVIQVFSGYLVMHMPIQWPTLLSIKILMISSVWVTG